MAREEVTDYKITDLQAFERQHERLEKQGVAALSLAQLLAILIRVEVNEENALEVAQKVLDRFKRLRGLQSASFIELFGKRGNGRTKAAQIQAAVELGNRLSRERVSEKVTVNSLEDTAALIQYEMGGLDNEEIWKLLLDTRNRLIEIRLIYIGSLNSALARSEVLFKSAILNNTAGMILVNNDSSGDPSPSREDIAMTRNLFDIAFVDHLVITPDNFVSLKERHLGIE